MTDGLFGRDRTTYECDQCGIFEVASETVTVHFCPECGLIVEEVPKQ